MSTKYLHLTKSGQLAKRTTQNRTYTHVVIVHVPAPYVTSWGAACKAGDFVRAWIGRPDLVAGAVKSNLRYNSHGQTCYAEPINNGVRA